MATFQWAEGCLDLFTGVSGTNLTAHTPTFGQAWTAGAGFAPKLDGSGGAYQAASVGDPSDIPQICAKTPVLAADQSVECQVHLFDDPGTRDNKAGPLARITAATTFYALVYQSESDAWALLAVVAGVATVLAGAAVGAVAGDTIALQLEVVGDQLTAIVNSEPQDPVTDATIAGAGAAGFACNPYAATTAANGIHVRQFLAGSN